MMTEKQIDIFFNCLNPLAKKDGVSFDFFAWKTQTSKVSYENKKLKNNSFSQGQNFCIRLLQDKKVASSYTKDFSKQSVEQCYHQALESLHISDNEEACQLSEPQDYKKMDEIFNPKLSAMALQDKINKAKLLDEAALSVDSKASPVNNEVSDGESSLVFGNSQGARGLYSSSSVSAYSHCLAVDGSKRSDVYFSQSAKDYSEIDFKKIGEQAASKALEKLDFIIPKTGNYKVVFDSETASPTLLSLLLSHLNSKQIYEKASLLKANMLGEKKFSSLFSLYDDPFASWGLASVPFDGEGFASQKTQLIENGMIKNYLSDSFCAEALKIPHTAKASRSESGSVGASSTNVIMKEGEISFKKFSKQEDQFVVIDDLVGLAGYNSTSGDFSIQSKGFLWDKGEPQAICQFTVSGNLLDVFSNISKVFNDSKIYGGEVKSPSFLVPSLSIAGS